MRSKRLHVTSERETDKPVPGESRQELSPCQCQRPSHRDTLLPFKQRLETEIENDTDSALRRPASLSPLWACFVLLALRAVQGVPVASPGDRSGQGRCRRWIYCVLDCPQCPSLLRLNAWSSLSAACIRLTRLRQRFGLSALLIPQCRTMLAFPSELGA